MRFILPAKMGCAKRIEKPHLSRRKETLLLLLFTMVDGYCHNCTEFPSIVRKKYIRVLLEVRLVRGKSKYYK